MKINFLALVGISVLFVACGGNSGAYRASPSVGTASPNTKSKTIAQPSLEEAVASDEADIETAESAPVPSVKKETTSPAPTPVAKAVSPSEVAASTIDAADFPANRKGPMKNSVQNLIVAVETGNQQQVAEAERRLLVVALNQGGIGGFNLAPAAALGALDIAAIIDLIKDLIAAIQAAKADAANAAAVQDAVQKLLAAAK